MNITYFREMAARALRLARGVTDDRTKAALLKAADDYEAKAKAMSNSPTPEVRTGEQSSQQQQPPLQGQCEKKQGGPF